ncbi:MAG: GNAT family N-acetyltransferase [Myxococcota bacterium]
MSFEIRPATQDEMGQMGSLAGYVYGGTFGDGPDNVISQSNRPEWTLCAFDGPLLVASSSYIPFTMRANGNAMPLAGVSAVGTLPEYRRKGLIRRITTRAFADMRERGQAVAALWASQAAIYQRYGYAMTSVQRAYSVDTVDIGFHDGDPGSGSVERLDVDAGYDVAKKLYIDYVADRTCYLHRARPLWQNNVLEDIASEGPIHIGVSYDASGGPRGYVVYTLRSGRREHPSRDQEIVVRDLAWLTLDAYRSLWSFLARHDLVGRVRWRSAPLDDPAPELFLEPRLLNARDHEGIWFRVVDVGPALEGRGYDVAGEISLEVGGDDLAPWNIGTYRLEASPDGAKVSRSDGPADVQMSVKTLASLYTGFRTARELAAWGLLSGSDDGVRRADALFRTHHAPHCPDHF